MKQYYKKNGLNTFKTGNLLSIMATYRTIIIVSIFVLFIMVLSLSIISTKVNAEKSNTREKRVTSIKIEKGDSLWSIANRYITEDYEDMDSYIKEIMYSNDLTSDVIYEGNYLIVPYYNASK